MQGHYLRESDFPLEMGGAASRAEKSPQLRPRGEVVTGVVGGFD